MTLIGLTETELSSGILAIFFVALILTARALACRFARPSAETPVAPVRHQQLLGAKLSSKSLASMIVESLAENKLLTREKIAEAVSVAERKIDLRKALGDY
jgi:hypothetical protein